MTKKELMQRTNKELIDYAQSNNISLDGCSKKTEYVDAILKAHNPETEDKKVEKSESRYAVGAMRKALIRAHEINNAHAITTNEALCNGATKEQFDFWKTYCAKLKGVVDQYVTINLERCSKDEKKAAFDKIFPIWRELLKEGEEDAFHPNMWIDEHDAINLIHYDMVDIGTIAGTQRSTQTPDKFRKGVETYIGIKMSGNKVMTAENRDTLLQYQSASKRLETLLKRLEGQDVNDKHVNGIIDDLKEITEKIDTKQEELNLLTAELEELNAEVTADESIMNDKWFKRAFDSCNARIDMLKEELKALRAESKGLKGQKEQCEKSIATTKEDIAKVENKAKEIQDALKRIQDEVDASQK